MADRLSLGWNQCININFEEGGDVLRVPDKDR